MNEEILANQKRLEAALAELANALHEYDELHGANVWQSASAIVLADGQADIFTMQSNRWGYGMGFENEGEILTRFPNMPYIWQD